MKTGLKITGLICAAGMAGALIATSAGHVAAQITEAPGGHFTPIRPLADCAQGFSESNYEGQPQGVHYYRCSATVTCPPVPSGGFIFRGGPLPTQQNGLSMTFAYTCGYDHQPQ